MAWVLPANPNSADVERLIPTYIKIEEGGESRIAPEKLNKYIDKANDLASFEFHEQLQRYEKGKKKQL